MTRFCVETLSNQTTKVNDDYTNDIQCGINYLILN